MKKHWKRRRRQAYLPIGLGILILLLIITHGNLIAKGSIKVPFDQSWHPKIEKITIQVGQEEQLPPNQAPFPFQMESPEYSTDKNSPIDVDRTGRIVAVSPGEANVYEGAGPLRLKVAKVNIQAKKIIYLTFDDGPSKNITAQILKILNENQIKGTFFLVGQYVNYYPELVKKIDEQGEVIGIHSDTHIYKNIYKNNEALLRDVNTLEKKLYHILNKKTVLYRFPGGSTEVEQRLGAKNKKQIIQTLNQEGYRCFDWDASLGDSGNTGKTVEKMLQDVQKEIKGKSRVIVLSHDMGLMKNTPAVISGLIKYCRKEGYVFDTLDHYPGQKLFP
jgi:peptidoglycan-N-acetylglucosamine deacetylase